jgi:hypothetical protein
MAANSRNRHAESARHRLVMRSVLGLLLSACLVGESRAQVGAAAFEYRIKAAFLCKFASYVEWPVQAFAQADSPVVVGVIGPDAVAAELTRTASALSVGGRSIVVRRVHRGQQVAGLHLLYIACSDSMQFADMLSALHGQPVLTVTESPWAVPPESMINFVVVDDKVRFDIAPRVAELNKLKISARLLGVARSLIGQTS